jgi:hypothetical protein
MKIAPRWVWATVGVVVTCIAAIYIAETFWVGGRTVYFDDCKKRIALENRLRLAGIPFEHVERGGISLGRVDEKELASRMGLASLLDVPPDSEPCK